MQWNSRSWLALVLAVIGVGMLVYGALLWYRQPSYSDADITAAIELNLQLDMARVGAEHAPTPEQLTLMRRAIREEVADQIAQRRATLQHWLAGGAALLAMALGQHLTQRYLGRSGVAPGPR